MVQMTTFASVSGTFSHPAEARPYLQVVLGYPIKGQLVKYIDEHDWSLAWVGSTPCPRRRPRPDEVRSCGERQHVGRVVCAS